VIPDADGLGIIADILTRNTGHPLEWWAYHHILGHNIGFCLPVVLGVFFLSGRKFAIAALAFLSFHLHLLGDLLGARGPEGYQWPIPYLSPFSDAVQLTWEGQWHLNAWPNFLITGGVMLLIFHIARRRGFSPLEMISHRADKAFAEALRRRFGKPF
jgi:hypothetical protein